MPLFRYLGGKQRIADWVVSHIRCYSYGFDTYIEPFVGAGSVLERMVFDFNHVYASDLHPELIAVYKALQDSWIPPQSVSEDDYQYIKEHGTPAEKGFVGFGCSFGAKYNGGYARGNENRNYAKEGFDNCVGMLSKIERVQFSNQSYEAWSPDSAIIYCDPPYQGTTGYAVGAFDHDRFWQWVRVQGQKNVVIVSETQAPDDITCIAELKFTHNMQGDNLQQRIERLYICKPEWVQYRGQLSLWD